MKRGWIGLGLLAVLLVGGLLVTWRMDRCHDAIAQNLDDAADSALAEDWTAAAALAQQAKHDWETGWNFSAAFADHEPMEEIDSQFAQLAVYGSARDGISFAAVCAQLARQVEAMGDAHGLTWWNLL